MKSLLVTAAIFLSCLLAPPVQGAPDLASSFRNPPDEARPWVFWFWINGTVTYRKTFELADAALPESGAPLRLDLGQVEVVARVTLNDHDCGIVWKPPYQVAVTHAMRPGLNTIEIEVANTWVNRLIGDEHLPLDSKWKDPETLLEWPEWFKRSQRAPGGRLTFTTNRHYTRDSPLQPAGLLGPVRLLSPR